MLHLRGLIEFRVLILIEIGLVFSVGSLANLIYKFQEREEEGKKRGRGIGQLIRLMT